MTAPTRLRPLVVGLAAVALTFAACSSADETTTTEAPAPAPQTTVAPAAVDVNAVLADVLVTMPDGYFSVGDVAAFKTAVDTGSAYVIDVREPTEYEEGHIPGAVNIPIRELTKHLDAIPMDQPVIIYCASGYRAAMSTAALQTLGFDNVKAFPASYKGWTAANEPVATDAVELAMGTAPVIEPDLLAAVEDFLVLIPEGYYSLGTTEKMEAAMAANAFVVDVREPSEFAEGRIPGSTNIPLRTLIAELDTMPTDAQVVVYCKSGYRAAIANAVLHIAGLDNTMAFPPSWLGWTEAGLEVEA